MIRRGWLSWAAAATVAGVPSFLRAAPPGVVVYRSPYCGCCGAWVEHMKAAGFDVKVTQVDDTSATRARYGLPDRFASCHTAVVGGYVVEGHVPAAEVKKMLATRPAGIGLAVPGMPPGSPGMETGGGPARPYDVLFVRRDGQAAVAARYPKT